MAQRRMFSKDIVCSDAFLSMSVNARALYFHLAMNADERGYVNNVRSVMSMFDDINIGHLQEIIASKFILDRENSLYVIKHWYIHNDIPRFDIGETKYLDDLKNLYFDENFSYTVRTTEKPVVETLKSYIKEKKGNFKGNKKK